MTNITWKVDEGIFAFFQRPRQGFAVRFRPYQKFLDTLENKEADGLIEEDTIVLCIGGKTIILDINQVPELKDQPIQIVQAIVDIPPVSVSIPL